jgi:hypothetical protein
MSRRSIGPSEAYVRAKRISLSRQVSVEAKTLGTRIPYHLVLANFSRSGLSITSAKAQHIPYQISTLVEMTVDPRSEVLESPVRCLGKIVRTGLQGQGPQFGVQLIMMEARDELEWQKAIIALEIAKSGDAEPLLGAA